MLLVYQSYKTLIRLRFLQSSLTTLLFSLLTLFIMQTASAHHSVNYHFNPEAPNQIEGVVKDFSFRNPHTIMLVDVSNEDGSTTTWHVEMTSRATLQKQGWTTEQFLPGQKIKIDGFLSRAEENSMYLRFADLGNGKTITFDYGKLAGSTGDSSSLDIDKSNTSVIGTWVRAIEPEDPTRNGQPIGPNEINPYLANLTPEGLTAAQQYVAETDDPSFNCQAASITRVWAQPDFSPTKISLEGDTLSIQHEVFDLKRTVHMNTQHPDSIEPSLLGHSIGKFDGDTLIIDTIGFKAGVLVTHPGIYHTDQLRVVERLSVSEKTGRMSLEWSATDPSYFANAQSGQLHFARSDLPISQFNCEID